MTLLEAFREIGPVDPTSPTRARRSEACQVVYEALVRLGARVCRRVPESDRHDLVGVAVCRMMQNGPRGIRAADPQNDDAVRGYLGRVLKNAMIDLDRRARRVTLRDDLDPPSGEADAAEQLELRELKELLSWAETELFDRIVPHLAATTRAGQGLIDTVDLLRQIRSGLANLNEVVRAECGEGIASAQWRTTRNKFDQRISRARTYVYDAIVRREGEHAYSESQSEALRRVLQSLSVRS